MGLPAPPGNGELALNQGSVLSRGEVALEPTRRRAPNCCRADTGKRSFILISFFSFFFFLPPSPYGNLLIKPLAQPPAFTLLFSALFPRALALSSEIPVPALRRPGSSVTSHTHTAAAAAASIGAGWVCGTADSQRRERSPSHPVTGEPGVWPRAFPKAVGGGPRFVPGSPIAPCLLVVEVCAPAPSFSSCVAPAARPPQSSGHPKALGIPNLWAIRALPP